MNGETLQRIVEEIVSRLQRRAQSTATLSVTQLRDADCPALFCQHALLRILLVDLPLLGQLADAETDEYGLPLVLHAGSVLSYRDVALLSRGRLVVHRKCIVTAMARDAANARYIQLIKQE